MKILVSIPAYNEEKDIARVIKEIKEAMRNYDYDIQVIDDGSTDKTVEIAKRLNAKVYSHPTNLGLAEAFRTEIKEFLNSKADILIHTDADLQYPAKYMIELIKKIEQGYDLVLGSRFLGKIERMPLIKRLGNKAFSIVLSKMLKLKITDAQTGFRAFNRKVASLPITSDHTYTQEQLIRVARNKMRIIEIPIYGRETRASKLMKNPFDYAIKAWINILRIYRDYQPLKFFGTFGTIFLGLGLVIGISLIIRFLITGTVGHLPLTILTMLLILLGIQIWLFGFLADMNRK